MLFRHSFIGSRETTPARSLFQAGFATSVKCSRIEGLRAAGMRGTVVVRTGTKACGRRAPDTLWSGSAAPDGAARVGSSPRSLLADDAHAGVVPERVRGPGRDPGEPTAD